MATDKLQIYKCASCGIITEILDGGDGQLACCDKPMVLLEESTADAATEKHVPVFEEVDEGVKVKVGSIPHPMEEDHFIEWIEVLSGGKAYRHFLQPGDAPEALFEIKLADLDTAREYCSVHNLWKS